MSEYQSKSYVVELRQKHYIVIAGNNKIVETSQHYKFRFTARRAAKKRAKQLVAKYREKK